MPERRFRDMRLTEEEALRCIETCARARLKFYHPGLARKIRNRAKRLLPLWRDIGLRELRYNGWIDGHNYATSRKGSPF